MEQFDSFNPVSIQAMLAKIENIGFSSPSKEIKLMDNILKIADRLVINFLTSKQQSIICFYLEENFLKTQSKRQTFENFNSFLNSLEQYNTKQSSTILYLFQVDQCLRQAAVYQKCNKTIRDFTKICKEMLLDNVSLKFNDIINISQLIFDELTVDAILKLISVEVQQNSQTINPFVEISASQLTQIMIIYDKSKAQKEPFQTPKRKVRQSEQTHLQGFYKWDSKFFSEKDFYKNPNNLRLLQELDSEAKKYPKTRMVSSQFNYYSPLPMNQTRSDFESKDSLYSDFLKQKSSSKQKSPLKSFQQSSGKKKDQSTLKFLTVVKQNGCILAQDIPKNQTELIKLIQIYQLNYFDPLLKLPAPLDNQITYEHLIDLYTQLEPEITFRKQNYKALQYFSSSDPRYLQIDQSNMYTILDENIIGISQIDGWILGKNEFGHIGCCADTYIFRL